MTVCDMLELCNDASEIRIRIFDCNNENIIFDSNDLDYYDNAVSEIIFSDMAEYDVCSYELYLGGGTIILELNINYEPEEEVM